MMMFLIIVCFFYYFREYYKLYLKVLELCWEFFSCVVGVLFCMYIEIGILVLCCVCRKVKLNIVEEKYVINFFI